jgi:hypothetical protein
MRASGGGPAVGALWRTDTSDVHTVIHNQWTRRDRSGLARTGLGTVTLCTQLWIALWMTVHDAVDDSG